MILGLGISYRNQGNLVLAKDKHLDYWSRIHSTKIGPHIHVFFFFFFTKVTHPISGKQKVFQQMTPNPYLKGLKRYLPLSQIIYKIQS